MGNLHIRNSANYGSAFYTTPAIKEAYKNYVKAVVSRYVDSPAIFGWELANEPRCSGALKNGGNCNTAMTTVWIKEMSEYVKSLDNNHMVAIGDEGFFARTGNPDWCKFCIGSVRVVVGRLY